MKEQKTPIEVVPASFQVLSPANNTEGQEIIRQIEAAARTCYKSEGLIAPGSAAKLVTKLRDRGHHAMLEFGQMQVRFVVDRGVTHEMVRHRVCSWAQESTRWCNYERHGIRVIEPPGLSPKMRDVWLGTVLQMADSYTSMVSAGVKPEIARSVLPNCTAAEIVASANLREWRHIFEQRALNPFAHPQMREVMVPLLREAAQRVPVVFEDLLTRLDAG